MSQRVLLATFEHEDDILGATREVRRAGLSIIDAFTPYAVHGLDGAMGLKPSRLTWVCFFCGITGALGMLWFQHWVAAISWPLDVGGKPWNSLPADVPVAFEAAVLLAGFGSVFALLGVSRLFPGKRARVVRSRITDDHFVLMIDEADAAFDKQAVERLLQPYDVVEVSEHLLTNQGDVT
jgi:hypothetical protein